MLLEFDGQTKELSEKLTNVIPKLGENATEAEVTAYRQAIGVPEKPEEYKIEKPADYPQDMPFDEQLVKTFADTAHKLNLTPQQTQGLYKMFLDYDVNIYKDVNKHITDNREKAVNTLKNVWKGDAYTTNTEETKRSFKQILTAINIPAELGGAEAVIKEFDESGFGDHPAMVYMFYNLFQKISDDKFIAGADASGGVITTPGMLSFPSMEKK